MKSPSDAERMRIGPHQVIAKLGEGVLGDVYLVRLHGAQRGSDRAVLKQVRAALLEGGDFESSIVAEVQHAVRLDHPQIARTYGACRAGGQFYVAMEYLDGRPWSRSRAPLRKNDRPGLWTQLQVLADTLAGLQHAHERGVTHGGVNPQNVYLTHDGRVKLANFGANRAMAALARPLPHDFTGDLAYFAPEQMQGEPIDCGADIFAVGVMLWEALAGRWLQPGERAESLPIDACAADLSIALCTLCTHALAIHPDQRLASAQQFRDGLLQHLYPSVVACDPAEAQIGSTHAAIAQPASASEAKTSSRGARALSWCEARVGVLSMAGIGASVLLAVALWQSGSFGTEPSTRSDSNQNAARAGAGGTTPTASPPPVAAPAMPSAPVNPADSNASTLVDEKPKRRSNPAARPHPAPASHAPAKASRPLGIYAEDPY